MKMLKKILLGTLVLATALAFTSCGLSEDQEKAISRSGKVNYTNDGRKDFYRSFVSTDTKHEDADALITIENADAYVDNKKFSDNSVVVSKGVFGFIFGLVEVTDKNNPVTKDVNGKQVTVKFYNFGIAGVRWNAKDDQAEWYVSWCKNVPDTVFNYTDSKTFVDSDLIGAPDDAEEIVIAGSPWDPVALNLDSDGNFVAMIKTDETDEGEYIVKICDADGNVKATAPTIPQSVTGYTTKEQRLIGRYITVYKYQTVKGSIKYKDVNAGVIPEDDVGIVLE